MGLIFYDHEGTSVCYTDDYQTIYAFTGDLLAYLVDDLLFSFSGTYKGRYENGWVRDHQGKCVFFTRVAVGGPIRPDMKPCPEKCPKKSLGGK